MDVPEDLSLIVQNLIDRTKALVAIQELHDKTYPCDPGCCDEELCAVCHEITPCETRRLADEALNTN